MLLRVDVKAKSAERIPTQRLREFKLDELGLQEVLYGSLDRLIPDDELLTIMRSRKWQEEPDLMALDRDGRLYIFELKAWEARSENLLQVLRYGQIFGPIGYEALDDLFRKFDSSGRSLADAHAASFDVKLPTEGYNLEQRFVVMTNGMDHRTREAVRYWRQRKLDMRPWIYRAYRDADGGMLLEISPFAVEDNPYEDVAQGFYFLNTNIRNSQQDHEDMLQNKKAAAYFSPNKQRVERLAKGDVIFLYQSGVGLVAMGTVANAKVEKRAYHNNPQHAEEEYFRSLTNFKRLGKPLSPAKIKNVTGINHRFMGTIFAVDGESGRALAKRITDGA